MPIYEIRCRACGQTTEVIISRVADDSPCPACGANDTHKLMSAPSSLSGNHGQRLPGQGDTTCCSQDPRQSSCDGPGSCCGRRSS